MKVASRWKPGHVVRRDTEAGLFVEINSPVSTRTELHVQTALLKPRPANLDLLWNQIRKPSSSTSCVETTPTSPSNTWVASGYA
jgi:hypothetical protein